MNWVGGSRNRLVMKADAKKQREFFAKKKLQQRLKNLGVAMPSSSSSELVSSGSTDLLTLFVVNQIASKKTNQEPPKVAVFGKGSRHWRNEPIVLPMTPCSPSHLSLVESPAESSVQEIRKQKIPHRNKHGQLSPVLESAFSDNSASDYLPPVNDPTTSVSPSSSSLSGQGLLPLRLNLQKQSQTQSQPLPHYSPPSRDTSVLQQAEFQPFFQPRGMTNPVSWTVRSNPPPFQLESPTTSQFLSGSSKPDRTGARGHGRHSGPFILSEANHLFEEEAFKQFNEIKHETETASFGNTHSKEDLRQESSMRPSTPQTVPNPQAIEMEEEPCCEPCHEESDFYLDEECCDNLRSASQRITVLSQRSPLTPIMRSKMIVGGNQNMMGNEASTDKASGYQQTGSFMALSSSPGPLGEIHHAELCRCKKALTERQDAGTQTENTRAASTCDASSQCSFVTDLDIRASGFGLYRPAVAVPQQFPENDRETDMEPQTFRASSKGSASKEGVSPCSWKNSMTDSGSRISHSVTVDNILQRPINALIGFWRPRGKENGDEREQTEINENNPLVNQESEEGRKEFMSAGRGHIILRGDRDASGKS